MKRKKREKKIGIFDIETKNWTEIVLIGLVDCQSKNIYYFRTVKDFIGFIDREKYSILFAYNLSFDGLFVIEYLIKNSILIDKVLISNSKILRFRYNKIIFRDLLQFYNTSLKNASDLYLKDLKLPKLEIDYSSIDKNIEELKKYLKRDLIIEYFLFKRIEDIVLRKLTLRSYVFDLITKDANIKLFEDFEIRKQFFGGRCELFYNKVENDGNKKYVYDVNSLYPYVMLHKLPTQFIGEVSYEFFQENKNNGNLDFLILFDYVEDKNGYFPIYDNFKNMYAIGLRRNIFLFYSLIKKFEIDVDMSFNNVLKIFAFKTGYLNRDLIMKLYIEKKKNPYYKIMLNSVYGKFAMLPYFKEYIFLHNYEGIKKSDKIYHLKKNLILIEREKEEEKNSNVILAKFITDYSRMYVKKDIEKIQNAGYNVYYTDTDSIHTNISPEEFEKITGKKINEKIGNYKIEYEFYSSVYNNPKDYILYNKKNEPITIKKKGFEVKDNNIKNEFTLISVMDFLKTGNIKVKTIVRTDKKQKYYKELKGNQYLYKKIDFNYFNSIFRIYKKIGF